LFPNHPVELINGLRALLLNDVSKKTPKSDLKTLPVVWILRLDVPSDALYGINLRTPLSKTQFTKVSALLTSCINDRDGTTIIFSPVPVPSQSTAVVVTFVNDVELILIQGV
jgi:hypothetical protein